mmetsp:Transcript_46146/g.100236  ORF Transcript_46146/g.100236 Transcript_46146/m.100236 type:complete len:400 (+) Transcript_46146:78-1277(+)|eukprot:CAMPEP_0170600336 /NCGR_PEP_ID=MMETSP0224-20130122/17280_1 /TAXON_ID=285029 /ORGANISM="Togula jolla, Strain CCCM 725" /LENGTH=399 /DNA_ID=CAMNT_0010925055 /DNA_START=62 /DNA_END=1261 /DNA_ORIENTATION=-
MVAEQTLPLKVQNTFISVDSRYAEDDVNDVSLASLRKRQVSEPAPLILRQISDVAATPKNSHLAHTFERLEEDSAEDEPREPEGEPIFPDPGWSRMVTGDWMFGAQSWMLQSPWQQLDYDGMRQNGLLPDMMQMPLSQQALAGGATGGKLDEIDANQAAALAHSVGIDASNAVPSAGWADTRTVMMRNLPNKYTQQMLVEELDACGFQGTFDFLYLPIDPETSANKGYAFINFLTPNYTWMFKMAFEGRKMKRFNSSKHVIITPAALQGFAANHAHYSNARVSRGDPATRPLFLREPANMPLPTGGRRRRRRGGGGSAIDVAARRVAATKEQSPQLQPAQLASQEAPGASWSAPAQETPAESDFKFCPFCGGKVQSSFRFCQLCGAALRFTASQEGAAV